jgi:hypothetical protein
MGFKWLNFLMLSVTYDNYHGTMTSTSTIALARIMRHMLFLAISLLFWVVLCRG